MKRPLSKPPKTAASGAQRVRIIGGRWRGTKLDFPAVAALRPTPDRVRETVFNWLQQPIVGARCLDLFAGSGALGLEALSRGATQVLFVDREASIGQYLERTLQRLHADAGEVLVVDGFKFVALARPATIEPFNVVFLDPPFALSGQGTALTGLLLQLEHGRWLDSEAWIYIEAPAAVGEPTLPPHWSLHRSKYAGQVGYHLARRSDPSAA